MKGGKGHWWRAGSWGQGLNPAVIHLCSFSDVSMSVTTYAFKYKPLVSLICNDLQVREEFFRNPDGEFSATLYAQVFIRKLEEVSSVGRQPYVLPFHCCEEGRKEGRYKLVPSLSRSFKSTLKLTSLA